MSDRDRWLDEVLRIALQEALPGSGHPCPSIVQLAWERRGQETWVVLEDDVEGISRIFNQSEIPSKLLRDLTMRELLTDLIRRRQEALTWLKDRKERLEANSSELLTAAFVAVEEYVINLEKRRSVAGVITSMERLRLVVEAIKGEKV